MCYKSVKDNLQNLLNPKRRIKMKKIKRNKLNKRKTNDEKGITLIALIITVIILLILAGTAISIAINGRRYI